MTEYILANRPGYSVEDAVENTNFDNAVIKEYDRGVWQRDWCVLPVTMYMFNPSPHPKYQRQQKLVLREGEKTLRKPIPDDKVTTDVNPFFQLIHRAVKEHERLTLEEITRILIHDYMVFGASRKEKKIIKKLVEVMHKKALLIKPEGDDRYGIGLTLDKGDRMVDFEKGFDPFEYHIMNRIENKNMCSNDEIHKLVIEGLKWTRNDKLVENYLNRLQYRGYIERRDDYNHFLQPLEAKSTSE